MSHQGLSNKPNTVAVIVHQGGGIEIFGNGMIIHPPGGPDNNPLGKFISQLGEPLAQTEQIEDPAMKAALRSAISNQVMHVAAANLPGGQSSHHVLTCTQMRQQIAELRQQAAKTTDRAKHQSIENLIASDEAILDQICSHGSSLA